MEYRPLGRTGISVSQLCLGAMMFGAFGNPDHDESIAIVHRALDAGINFIDTADFYSFGESEEICGKALAGGRRDDVVLATKVGLPFDQDPNHKGGSRRWIVESVERSLRRLGTDWIDLLQRHPLDPTPRGEENLGRERFRTEQPPYSLLARGIEYDTLPTARRHGLGVLTYSPLNGGWLSGRYRKGQEIAGPQSPARSQKFADRYDLDSPANAAKFDAADALGALADEAGITLVQMAISFVTRHPAVTAAIVGPRTME